MALSAKLELRQGQSLVMTPQLMQAIKLLQLSNLDLEAYVAGELERNPLLERGGEDGTGEANEAGAPGESAPEAPADDPVRAAVEALDAEPADAFPEDAVPGPGPAPAPADGPSLGAWPSERGAGSGSGEGADLEAFAASERTLRQRLEEEIALSLADPARRLIARAMLEALDEAGYMREPLAALGERMGAASGEVEATLAVLQGLEPTGIFARDLAECLALQLRERDRFDPAMQALVANLDLLARRDFPALRRVCGVEDDDLADMLAELRRLNPRPGAEPGAGPAQPVVPDVIVRAGADGAWRIELNADTLPRVLVNQTYYARIARGGLAARDKTYLSECLQNANWLVKSLDQRARTIVKVAGEIVRRQDGFLAEGVHHLRPLNLRAVAEAIGMHESTVSRVTANKYMSTPRGVFEMKYFFTAAIPASGGGEAHSAEAVRHRIRRMIDGEPSDAVLSDDEIVRRLGGEGVDIARRTVAKYREAMRIPSSVRRRREKALAAP